jgi:2-dehydro-3-deoxyphosphogluconate aldolase/(4S)-4-hydroxy-2-oxoglutarate aldolase
VDEVFKKIYEIGIIPVIKIQDAKDAVPLGKALIAGSLPLAEITFRTSAAEEAIRRMKGELPGLLIGAGTILSVDQAAKALAAGAEFIVSPGFNPKVVDYCVERNVPVTPGVNSPTTIEMALERGLKVLKFFPAETSGGLAMLKAMSGPYGGVQFIPTGGVNTQNLQAYLSSSLVYACGGSWIAKADLISEGNFAEITRLAHEAVMLTLGFSLAHVGIYEASPEKAIASAKLLSGLFHFPLKEGTSSVFAGRGFEVTKAPGLGKNGHLAIGTLNIQRAVAYLKRQGIEILPDSAKEKNGKMIAVFLKQEISGFALHLLQD